MKKLIYLFLCFVIPAAVYAKAPLDDLSPLKMEKAASKILDIFKSGESEKLSKYISKDWLDDKNIDIKKYQVNNYSPQNYKILFSVSDVVVAEIAGELWKHLMIFKFVEEDGQYRVVPKGISQASSDYIDPWWDVVEYYGDVPEKYLDEEQPPTPQEEIIPEIIGVPDNLPGDK